MHKKMEAILSRVQKPARYVGGEWGSVMKDKKNIDLRFAFCFPDTYEVAMSHLGSRILYGLLNDQKGIWCERVCAPWIDMEAEMREAGLPLYGLESGDPLSDFDIIAFTLQYELSFSNILNMLDLGGIPVLAKDRTELKHIVACGGPCAYNPEPLADFVDLFMIGDGEEIMLEFTDLYRKAKREGWSKQEFLIAAAQIEGMYVPSLYEVKYHEDGTIESVTPTHGAPALVQKRIVKDLDTMYYPESFVVPLDGYCVRPCDDRVVPRLSARLPILPGRPHLSSAAHQVQGSAAQAGAGGAQELRLRGNLSVLAVYQ